jgi:RNA-binding protein
MELKNSHKKYLRSLAHSYDPVIIIGINGVTESVVTAISKALEDHELIKVKFNKFKEDKKDLSEAIEARTESDLISIKGNVAIFYKKHPIEDKRKIFFDD